MVTNGYKNIQNTEIINISSLVKILVDYGSFHKNRIPFCAAENAISPFVRLPLSSDVQERYIMGGLYHYNIKNNFIGSEYLHPMYMEINNLCNQLFKSNYADARTLSGINAIITLLMSISKIGDTVLLSTAESGGHPSYSEICKRLGLKIIPMPYDYTNYNYDIEEINRLCSTKNISLVIFAPSDILFPPDLTKLNIPDNSIVIYDVTQTLGLIAGQVLPNPLSQFDNIILIGGTHKTLPGPTNGLILTNNTELAEIIDRAINPKFLRNTQMHQVLSLLFCLIEAKEFGNDYSNAVISNSNLLGKLLENKGFQIANCQGLYSKTHQLFIHISKNETECIFNNGIYYGISLNSKKKKLFNSNGIRLGVQEVTRYNWKKDQFEIFASVISEVRKETHNTNKVHSMINELIEYNTQIHYTFDEEFVSIIQSFL